MSSSSTVTAADPRTMEHLAAALNRCFETLEVREQTPLW